ncbi:MAG: type II toxin-antitoxin system VapC family toxin [Patescibacteria group bacterium]
MTSFLLDTCTFIWLAVEPGKLSTNVADIITNAENPLYLSSISAWEMIMKWRTKRLLLSAEPSAFIAQWREAHRIRPLAFDEQMALHLQNLPYHHRDPFDHMLICQALTHDLTILTPDRNFRKYKVKAKW